MECILDSWLNVFDFVRKIIQSQLSHQLPIEIRSEASFFVCGNFEKKSIDFGLKNT